MTYKRFLFPLLISLYFAGTVQSQIIYTDINPDSTVKAVASPGYGIYFLDLDNDNTSEFEIRHQDGGGGGWPNAVYMHCLKASSMELLVTSAGTAPIMVLLISLHFLIPEPATIFI